MRQPPGWVTPYVGIGYAARGRDRDEGLDCWGLVWLVYREQVGIWLDPFRHGEDEAAGIIAREKQAPEWSPVERGHERCLDVAIISMPCGDLRRWDDNHIGVVAERGHLLHILRGTASICQPYRDRPLGRRIKEFWRHRELA